jgi:hypothetical protein
VKQFYTAPTAIRSLMRAGDLYVKEHLRDSLRILGSVGEPINPEAWRWYHDIVGDGRCPIVDTWWQTETGGHMITPLPNAWAQKPGAHQPCTRGVVTQRLGLVQFGCTSQQQYYITHSFAKNRNTVCLCVLAHASVCIGHITINSERDHLNGVDLAAHYQDLLHSICFELSMQALPPTPSLAWCPCSLMRKKGNEFNDTLLELH